MEVGLDRSGWRSAGALIAIGAFVLGAGLLLGPTPAEEPADALRDIDGFRMRYIVTNGIDLVGVLVMVTGLLAAARLQSRAAFVGVLGGAANLAGSALISLVLVIQSAVTPEVAGRFVDARPEDRASQLAAGELVLDLEGALFGLGFMLQMAGIAALAVALMRGAGPRVDWRFLLAGAGLAAIASPTGIAYLFDGTEGFGRLEPVLGLATLAWLVALGVRLCREPASAAPASVDG